MLMFKNFARKNEAFSRGMSHATLDPQGPGVARLHLIPPKPSFFFNPPSVLLINGWHLLPVGASWAWLLREFLEELPKVAKEGEELTQEQITSVENAVIKKLSLLYPDQDPEKFRQDLYKLVNLIVQIAKGEKTIHSDLNIRDYAKYMTAPHRMDLVVSSMEVAGKWNCPLKCKNCYATGQELSGVDKELSTSEWKAIIDILHAAMVPQVTFTGGEPTMRSDLVELIGYSREFVTRLNTSGVLMTEELAKRLFEASLDVVQMTLYSADPLIHDELVGKQGAFEQTITGIKNALKAGLNVSINTPLIKQNSDYVALLALLRELGIVQVSCSGLIPAGKAPGTIDDGGALSNPEMFKTISDAVDFCSKNKMELMFTSPGWLTQDQLKSLGLTYPVCGAALSNMAITSDGTVVPCQSWLSQEGNLGNILSTPWNKIWNHPLSKKLRVQTDFETCPLSNPQEGGN